jgi:hypothetical protein
MRRALIVLIAATFFLAACSDDDDSGESQTTTDDTATPTLTGEVDTEKITADLQEVIIGDDGTPFDPELEVTEAGVSAEGTPALVIAPVDPSATLTQEQAEDVCAAAGSVVLRELPIAVTIVADGDGTPLSASTGPAGSCEATTDSVEEILAGH